MIYNLPNFRLKLRDTKHLCVMKIRHTTIDTIVMGDSDSQLEPTENMDESQEGNTVEFQSRFPDRPNCDDK